MDFSKYQPIMDEINAGLDAVLDGKPESLYAASRHLITAGGKRVRPLLCILSCKAVGGDYRDAVNTAIAIELIHNFTLVHDDIMDNDELRRGIKAVHTVYGQPTAILAGDLLFSKAFVLCDEDTVRILADASAGVCEGQEMDMSFEGRMDVGEGEYMEMIEKKTAVLLKAAAKAGAVRGNGTLEEIECLSSFGLNIGLMFQIKDDILGVVSDEEELGKPVGSDISEGKKNLIAIKAMHLLKGSRRERLAEILSSDTSTREEIDEALELFKNSGAIEYCAEKMDKCAETARESLLKLKESEARDDLLDLSDFIMNRRF